jgi:hypothetical protein
LTCFVHRYPLAVVAVDQVAVATRPPVVKRVPPLTPESFRTIVSVVGVCVYVIVRHVDDPGTDQARQRMYAAEPHVVGVF